MPEAVEMRLAIPPELGPEAEVREELRQGVATAEASIAAERLRLGRKVYGRRAVLQQSWWVQPTSIAPRRNLRPRVAARSKWSRIEALQRNRAFLVAYTTTRDDWRDGAIGTFPSGTYWFRRELTMLSRRDGVLVGFLGFLASGRVPRQRLAWSGSSSPETGDWVK